MNPQTGYKEQLKYWFIIATILASIRLWSFAAIGENVYKILELGFSMAFIGIILYYYKARTGRMLFKGHVILFLLMPIISAYAALHFHDQPMQLTANIVRSFLFWLFYFVLHIYNVPAQKIVKMAVVCGGIWAMITIVQQFTFPTYFFYMRSDEDYKGGIYRNGVYRFMIMGLHFGTFLLLYSFHRFLITRKTIFLAATLVALLGFYYYGTRQFALASFGCMFVATLLVKGKAKVYAFSLAGLLVLVLLVFGEQLFASYVEMTKEQWQYGENVRSLCAEFYLYDYWPHWTAQITGNGPSHAASPYGREMKYILNYFKFYRSDVGLIGGFSEYGIFYVINVIWLNIKGLRSKWYQYDDQYLRLVYLYALILIPTNESYADAMGIPFYCILMYLTEKAYTAKLEAQEKEAQEETPETIPALQMA